MPIKYINKPQTGSFFLRPQGYSFPVGLNNVGDAVDGPSSVDYLVIAGGGGGGGGGGGYGLPGVARAGGSGIVIIRYSGAQGAGGGNYLSSGGYSIHTFTGDGNFRSNVQSYLVN